MNRKEFQEWLNQFPEDAKICTDTNNHYSTDGIRYGTLIECDDFDNNHNVIGKGKILFIGNTRHVGKMLDGIGKHENWEYNLCGLKLLNAVRVPSPQA